MALPSVMYRFQLDISDTDRGFYDSKEFRVARHPSESDPFFITRVLAAGLHAADDVEFSRAGLCGPDDPPLFVRELTGDIRDWIDIGNPSPERLHKASKKASRVFVYTYRRAELLLDTIRKGTVHRKEELQLYALPADALDTLAQAVTRVNQWSIVRTDGELFVSAGDTHVNCPVLRLTL